MNAVYCDVYSKTKLRFANNKQIRSTDEEIIIPEIFFMDATPYTSFSHLVYDSKLEIHRKRIRKTIMVN